jgi:hypothetical protein
MVTATVAPLSAVPEMVGVGSLVSAREVIAAAGAVASMCRICVAVLVLPAGSTTPATMVHSPAVKPLGEVFHVWSC